MKERRVSNMGEEEIERLANRLAMLVSDDGEADNAGRAVGTLARRLGLSGGQLKAIFMAGAESAGPTNARLAARVKTLETEVADLTERLRRAESNGRSLQRHRDALRDEVEALRGNRERSRARLRGRIVLAVAVLAVAGGVVWVRMNGLPWHLARAPEVAASGAPVFHTAIVRDRPAALHRAPDTASDTLATLDVGTRLTVRRMLWHNLEQWVEVEVNGQSGYVNSTGVDLS